MKINTFTQQQNNFTANRLPKPDSACDFIEEPVRNYLRTLTERLLTPQEEIELGRRVQAGVLRVPLIKKGIKGIKEALQSLKNEQKRLPKKMLRVVRREQRRFTKSLSILMKRFTGLSEEVKVFVQEQKKAAKEAKKLAKRNRDFLRQRGMKLSREELDSLHTDEQPLISESESELRKKIRNLLIRQAKLEKEVDAAPPSRAFKDVKKPSKAVKTHVKEALPKEDDKNEERFEYILNKPAQKAKAIFTKHNLRLVVTLAKKFQNRGLPLLDLIQNGNLGLMIAVDRFDPELGFRFSTYATWWIRQSISSALKKDVRTIHLPGNKQRDIQGLNEVVREYEQTLGETPTDEQLAKKLRMPLDKLRKLKVYIEVEPLSLDRPAKKDIDARTLANFVEDEQASKSFEQVENQDLSMLLESALKTLSPFKADILRQHFGIGIDEKTLKEIGDANNYTRERIRQLKADALRELLESPYGEILKDYL